MAISNIPKINGPSYGGTIYGMSLEMNYSSSPSKLTLNIVSKDGTYQTPSLNSSVQITFGNFTFNGTVWSYSIKEDAQERTLQVEIIDNSIILDRYYVLLWKRGIFNDLGTAQVINKSIDLSDTTVVVPIRVGFAGIAFEEKTLGTEVISRTIYSAKGQKGNILYLGTEDFPNSNCDIPDTYYKLSDLVSISPVDIDIYPPDDYTATHEGTLREVIKAWAADCGVDFYWDYSANTIKYYDVSEGISSIPTSLEISNIIEKTVSESMEGTFRQYALAYTAYPKEALKTLSQSSEITYETTLNPFPVSFFLKRNNLLQNLNLPESDEGTTDDPSAAERNLWGGRTEDEFLSAAFLGYISEDLRDLYCATNGFGDVLGLRTVSTSGVDSKGLLSAEKKSEIINYLEESAADDLLEMRKIDSENLNNYNFYLCIKDDSLNTTWKQIEQEILQCYGSVYRHSGNPGTFYYCTPTSVTEITGSVDPSPSENEPQSSDFSGRKIFRRSGTMSHSQQQALAELELDKEESQANVNKLLPRSLDVISSGLKESAFNGVSASHVIMVPNKSLVNKIIGNLNVSIFSGSNALETTVFDMASEESENTCDVFDEQVENGSCKGAKEEAEEKQLIAVGLVEEEDNNNSPISGLKNRRAKGARIQVGRSKELKILAPSYGTYAAIYNYNFSIQLISNYQNNQKIFFNGANGTADDVASIEVIYDNVTDSLNDEYGKERVSSIPTAKSISNTNSKKDVTYVFAGEPEGLTLSPSNGLSNLDISYSSDGFKTTVSFSTRPEQRTEADTFLRKIESQLNRSTFNAS
jgi:hypothetical protein